MYHTRTNTRAQVRAEFPPHLYFALLGSLQQVRQPGCYIELNPTTGEATFAGRTASDCKVRFEHVLRRLKLEDEAKAQEFLEAGSTEGPAYVSDEKSVTPVPTSGHRPRLIASYSWNMADGEEPYAVPGRLRAYLRPDKPLRLRSEEVNESAPLVVSRGRPSVMEPIVMACCAVDPSFSLSDYQVVTDRNNLRKIFRWACGDQARWRIDLEKFGPETIVMLRFDLSEEGEHVSLQQRKLQGYRFEDLCCGGGVTTDSYRAVLDLTVADTRFLLRCEVDAMLATPSEELESALGQLSLDRESSPLQRVEGSQLVFQRSGRPLEAELVELTTMRAERFQTPKSQQELKDKWFQAYVAGIEKVVFGLKPKFDVDKIVELSPEELLDWFQMDPAKDLGRMMDVLRFVQEHLAGEPVGAQHSLYFEPTDATPAVRLRRRGEGQDRAFPEYVYEHSKYSTVNVPTEDHPQA